MLIRKAIVIIASAFILSPLHSSAAETSKYLNGKQFITAYLDAYIERNPGKLYSKSWLMSKHISRRFKEEPKFMQEKIQKQEYDEWVKRFNQSRLKKKDIYFSFDKTATEWKSLFNPGAKYKILEIKPYYNEVNGSEMAQYSGFYYYVEISYGRDEDAPFYKTKNNRFVPIKKFIVRISTIRSPKTGSKYYEFVNDIELDEKYILEYARTYHVIEGIMVSYEYDKINVVVQMLPEDKYGYQIKVNAYNASRNYSKNGNYYVDFPSDLNSGDPMEYKIDVYYGNKLVNTAMIETAPFSNGQYDCWEYQGANERLASLGSTEPRYVKEYDYRYVSPKDSITNKKMPPPPPRVGDRNQRDQGVGLKVPPPPPPRVGDGAGGKPLFVSKCIPCHGLDRVTARNETREGWDNIVKRMQEHNVGWISDTDASLIIEYLSPSSSKLLIENTNNENSHTTEIPFKVGTKWVGDYICGQGKTELVINIVQVEDNNIKGIFGFYHSPTGVRGSFYVSGKYDSKEKKLRLLPREWIEHPPGYQTVGMDGLVLSNPTRYEGVILNPYCGKFSVRLQEDHLGETGPSVNKIDYQNIPEMEGWKRLVRGETTSGYIYHTDGTLSIQGNALNGKFLYQDDDSRKALPLVAEELFISPSSPSGRYALAIAKYEISGDRAELLWLISKNSIKLVETGISRGYFSKWIKWSPDDNHAILLNSYESQSMSVVDISDQNRAKLYWLNLEGNPYNTVYNPREDYIWHDVRSFHFEDRGEKISGRIIITCDQHQDENCDMTKIKRTFNMTSDKYFSNIALQPID